jgi:hypothetical protein
MLHWYVTKTGYIYSSMNNRITSKSKDEDNGRSPFSDSSLGKSDREKILRWKDECLKDLGDRMPGEHLHPEDCIRPDFGVGPGPSPINDNAEALEWRTDWDDPRPKCNHPNLQCSPPHHCGGYD